MFKADKAQENYLHDLAFNHMVNAMVYALTRGDIQVNQLLESVQLAIMKYVDYEFNQNIYKVNRQLFTLRRD